MGDARCTVQHTLPQDKFAVSNTSTQHREKTNNCALADQRVLSTYREVSVNLTRERWPKFVTIFDNYYFMVDVNRTAKLAGANFELFLLGVFSFKYTQI